MATLHSSATKIHLASKAGRTMYAQLQAATAAATAATELHLSLYMAKKNTTARMHASSLSAL